MDSLKVPENKSHEANNESRQSLNWRDSTSAMPRKDSTRSVVNSKS